MDQLFAKAVQIHAQHRKDVPALLNRKGADAELFLYDAIGEGLYEGISAKAVTQALADAKDAKKLTVYINSPGGSFFDGKAIYSQLKRFGEGREVVTVVDGIAASAASLVLMAGTHIVAMPGSTVMVHEVRGPAFGRAQELRSLADLMDQENASMVSIYAQRTKLASEKIASILNAETWMDPQMALEKGFVDEIRSEQPQAAPRKMAALAQLERLAALAEDTKKHLQVDAPRRKAAEAKLTALLQRR